MIKVDNAKGLDEELKKSEKVLALFYASWCPYCVAFVQVFNKKAGDFGTVVVVHVLLDDYNNPLWDDYGIEAVPTIIFFEKGIISRRLDGRLGAGLNARQLEEWLQKIRAFIS